MAVADSVAHCWHYSRLAAWLIGEQVVVDDKPLCFGASLDLASEVSAFAWGHSPVASDLLASPEVGRC